MVNEVSVLSREEVASNLMTCAGLAIMESGRCDGFNIAGAGLVDAESVNILPVAVLSEGKLGLNDSYWRNLVDGTIGLLSSAPHIVMNDSTHFCLWFEWPVAGLCLASSLNLDTFNGNVRFGMTKELELAGFAGKTRASLYNDLSIDLRFELTELTELGFGELHVAPEQSDGSVKLLGAPSSSDEELGVAGLGSFSFNPKLLARARLNERLRLLFDEQVLTGQSDIAAAFTITCATTLWRVLVAAEGIVQSITSSGRASKFNRRWGRV